MKALVLFIISLLPALALGQNKLYTIVFLNKKANADALPKEQVDKIMEGHMANINRLAKEKKLLAAGPFDGGGGIFILNTTNIEQAQTWLQDDPGIQAKRWDVELLPYTPRVGSICPVGGKYEMIQYTLIRYDVQVSKFTAQDFPQVLKQHDDYLETITRTGNVVTEAIFGPRDGGILIVKGSLQQEVIEADPAVQQQLLNVQVRNLWIAKGSFCEN
jgi:uncharacterized protein YciI